MPEVIEKIIKSKVGTKWTNEEEAQLLKEIANNLSYEEIALEHKRQPNGIMIRVRQLAYKMFTNGKSIEEVRRDTKLLEKDLADVKKRFDANELKKKNKDKTYDVDELVQQVKNLNVNLEKLIALVTKYFTTN